ncbi:MAG: carboxypeptidase regulatory-like domain-containing protein, partial [Candidatus Eremiobacteraeota bacterium]|nr:carboxypeptidase regulatory-like domain-containing protein [Candidatus Eremiobacteraeota bacterium]
MQIRSIILVAAAMFAAVLTTVSGALAAGGKISGKVVDAQSGAALSGVLITASGPMQTHTMSRDDGSFALTKLVPGTYILITDLQNYGTAQTNGITVGESMNQNIVLKLTPQSDTAVVAMGS